MPTPSDSMNLLVIRNLLFAAAIAALGPSTVQAQATCADWAKVTAWEGTYQLNGPAKGQAKIGRAHV